jgi:putative FmdB family regulatory protein
MPIFEYVCSDCQARFESLQQGRTADAACPSCHGRNLEKQFSVFAVAARPAAPAPVSGPCGTCGDPRGPGACGMN